MAGRQALALLVEVRILLSQHAKKSVLLALLSIFAAACDRVP